MNIITEISTHVQIKPMKSTMKCKLFEDNNFFIKIDTSSILTPREKSVALEHHHFRWYVDYRFALLESIRTGEQTADIFIKPVPDS